MQIELEGGEEGWRDGEISGAKRGRFWNSPMLWTNYCVGLGNPRSADKSLGPITGSDGSHATTRLFLRLLRMLLLLVVIAPAQLDCLPGPCDSSDILSSCHLTKNAIPGVDGYS
jgi:hypothetical protein